MRANLNERTRRRCAARRCGTRSRTVSSRARSASPAASSSGCASHARSRLKPDVLLLDEPASALDPISTASIEELMHTLKREYTLVIVTHNMQQAARVAERTAFFSLTSPTASGPACSSSTTTPRKLFTRPADKRTEDYVTGPLRLGASPAG